MTIIYFAETDTLAVDLRDEPATETDDLTDDVLVDDNAQRQIVGLTIDQASKHVDLGSVQIEGLPRSTCSCALALLCRPERPKDDPQQMLEPPDHIDWDMACVHCGKELGDEDEVAALDVQRIGDGAYLRSLCASCAAHQDEHPADGRWIDAGDLPQQLGLWVDPPA